MTIRAVRTRKPCCGKVIRWKAGKGNIEGFAKHIGKKLGGDPDFYDKCIHDDEVIKASEGGDPSAMCARLHKLVVGVWPGTTGAEHEQGSVGKRAGGATKKKHYRLVVTAKHR